MSNMEILTTNYLDTTTLISVSSGSDTASYLFNRKLDEYYESSGRNTNTSGITIGVTFASNKNISRIALQGHNFKDFTIYYNSNPANTFGLTNCATTVSDWTQNSSTALYLKFTTINVSSIFILATGTMAGSDEKYIAQLWINDKKFTFENNPDSKGYSPKLNVKEVEHEMSDGGITKYTFGDAFQTGIKLEYQSDTMYSYLYDLYADRQSFVFVPFPTGTSWEGKFIYEVNWIGDFNFIEPAGNNWKSLGWSGQFTVKETPK